MNFPNNNTSAIFQGDFCQVHLRHNREGHEKFQAILKEFTPPGQPQ